MDYCLLGTVNTWTDLCLYLTGKQIEAPETQTATVQVPGRDGELDFSEALVDEPRYYNRTITIELTTIKPVSNWADQISEVYNLCHGKTVKVTFSDDLDYYYTGRASVSFEAGEHLGKFQITIDAEPWKYKQDATSKSYDLTSTVTKRYCTNDRMTAIPTFTVSDSATVIFDGVTYTMTKGDNTLLDIQFTEGSNYLQVSGSGTLTVTWQEGSL